MKLLKLTATFVLSAFCISPYIDLERPSVSTQEISETTAIDGYSNVNARKTERMLQSLTDILIPSELRSYTDLDLLWNVFNIQQKIAISIATSYILTQSYRLVLVIINNTQRTLKYRKNVEYLVDARFANTGMIGSNDSYFTDIQPYTIRTINLENVSAYQGLTSCLTWEVVASSSSVKKDLSIYSKIPKNDWNRHGVHVNRNVLSSGSAEYDRVEGFYYWNTASDKSVELEVKSQMDGDSWATQKVLIVGN
jgi:hypothetical protein